MQISPEGFMELVGHEGIVRRRYRDSTGVWTYGIGHTAMAGPPDPANILTEQPFINVLQLFKDDVKKYEKRVNDALKVPVLQHQFDALVSFDYNTGGIFKAAITKSINAGLILQAGDQFLNWSKPPEVIPRRKREQKLFRIGEYSNNGLGTEFKVKDNGYVDWSSASRVNLRPYFGITTPTPVPEVIKKENWFIRFIKHIWSRIS